jgi:phage regulator Rha-like protein
MRLISDGRGNYMTVLEEFKCKARPDSSVVYYIGQIGNELIVYNNGTKRIWTKSEFIEYYELLKPAQWRNPKIKEYYIEYYQMIINSFIRIERDRKIDEVLRDENEYQYWVC